MLQSLLKENNGYLFTSDVVEASISKTYMATFIRENKMEKAAHGIYIADDVWLDDLFILQKKNPSIIFSGETALYLQGLTEREYNTVSVDVPVGYNGARLRARGVKVHRSRQELYELGAVEIKTNFGNVVRTYDKERCFCDSIYNRDKLEVQVFQTAIQEYLFREDKNLSRLIEYAKLLKIQDEVMKYVEVIGCAF